MTEPSQASLPPLVAALTAAGVIPFAAGALYLIVPVGPADYYPFVRTAIAWWAVIILSFMAGTFWGLAIARRADPLLLIGSNVAAIAAWLALLLLPSGMIPLAISVLFALLLLLDWRAYSHGTVPLSYLRLRMAITSAVVVCLGVLVAAT